MQDTWVQSLGWEDLLKEDKPLQYSYLENPMDRAAWQATVHGVSKSWTQLSDIISDSATPWIVAFQAPVSMEFSRQECWNG